MAKYVQETRQKIRLIPNLTLREVFLLHILTFLDSCPAPDLTYAYTVQVLISYGYVVTGTRQQRNLPAAQNI